MCYPLKKKSETVWTTTPKSETVWTIAFGVVVQTVSLFGLDSYYSLLEFLTEVLRTPRYLARGTGILFSTPSG